CFTEQDVDDVGMVCLLCRTLVEELFGDESPIGKEVLVNDVPLRVLGVLSRKGTNIIGVDQDDILIAPWTTIKYRVSATSSASTHPATPSSRALEFPGRVTLLPRPYPRSQAGLYVAPSSVQMADTPRLERFTNVDSILVRAQSMEEISAAMAQITELLRER